MSEAVRRDSFISRFFSAIADVISGIREVIAVMVFGPKIMQSFYPEYNPNYKPAPASMQRENAEKIHNTRDEKSINSFERFKGNEAKTTVNATLVPSQSEKEQSRNQTVQTLDRSANILDISRDDYSYAFGISIPSETVVAEGCTPLSAMSSEEFKNTLEIEIKQEFQMHNTAGFIEIGGKYFTYKNDEDKDHDGVYEIEVKEHEQNMPIAAFELSILTTEDGERTTKVEMAEFYIDNFNSLTAQIVEIDNSDKNNPKIFETTSKNDIVATSDKILSKSEIHGMSDMQNTPEVTEIDETVEYADVQPDYEDIQLEIPIVAQVDSDVMSETNEIPLLEETPKLELSDFVKLAEKGDFESFLQGTKDCTAEELNAIKDEIDILTYTASVGLTRSNFEKAMEITEWQEEHIGETYDLIIESHQDEPSYIQDSYVDEEYDYDDDDWR